MTPTVEELIAFYKMKPHPEGGWYQETYRSEGSISRSALPGGFKGDRSYCTGILFLLPGGGTSKLHRIKSDEMWHFYMGDPMTVVQLTDEGRVELTRLGRDVRKGQKVQHVVPAGHWFGGYSNEGSAYSLVGCTVAPGFDFADFELASKEELIKQFPAAKPVIEHLGP